jgi:hypothetical protein
MECTKTKPDFDFHIKGREYNSRVFIDVYDEDGVWVSVGSGAGSTRIILSKSQAKEMIAALISVVNHLEEE